MVLNEPVLVPPGSCYFLSQLLRRQAADSLRTGFPTPVPSGIIVQHSKLVPSIGESMVNGTNKIFALMKLTVSQGRQTSKPVNKQCHSIIEIVKALRMMESLRKMGHPLSTGWWQWLFPFTEPVVKHRTAQHWKRALF